MFYGRKCNRKSVWEERKWARLHQSVKLRNSEIESDVNAVHFVFHFFLPLSLPARKMCLKMTTRFFLINVWSCWVYFKFKGSFYSMDLIVWKILCIFFFNIKEWNQWKSAFLSQPSGPGPMVSFIGTTLLDLLCLHHDNTLPSKLRQLGGASSSVPVRRHRAR